MKKKVGKDELETFARDFFAILKPKEAAVVVGLVGELGAGKTTFVQALARVLGVEEHVTSPTFVIEKIYKLSNQKFDHLIHIDAYRLGDGSELLSLGWKEIIEDEKNLILIEWPERVDGIIPTTAVTLLFEVVDEKTREITYD